MANIAARIGQFINFKQTNYKKNNDDDAAIQTPLRSKCKNDLLNKL